MWKHLKLLFLRLVFYNRFVELEKEVLLPLTIFIKEVLLETCTGISFNMSLMQKKHSFYSSLLLR